MQRQWPDPPSASSPFERNDGGLLKASVWSGKVFDSAWRSAPTTIRVDEPATGAILAEVGGTDATTVQTVVAKADKAPCEGGAATLETRARVRRKAAEGLEHHADGGHGSVRPWIAFWQPQPPGRIHPMAMAHRERIGRVLADVILPDQNSPRVQPLEET
jgi:hypothetical protein